MTRTLKTVPPLVLLLGLCFFIEPLRGTTEKLIALFGIYDPDAIKSYILSFGIWAPVVSFLLMIFQSLIAPLPAFLITFANAALFGWVKGAILSWSSAMAGAALCFFIARILGREVTIKLTNRFALQSVDDFFGKYGKHTILIARLLPFVSFDIVSYGAGLTSMTFWSFFWATGIGQLPGTLIYSYAGGMLVGSARTFILALLVLFAFSVLVFLLKQIWVERNSMN